MNLADCVVVDACSVRFRCEERRVYCSLDGAWIVVDVLLRLTAESDAAIREWVTPLDLLSREVIRW